MNLSDFLPDYEVFESARKASGIDHASESPAELLVSCLMDTYRLLWMPDELTDLMGFWPTDRSDCEDCALWAFLAEDIVTASLVYFRKNTNIPVHNLSELLKGRNVTGEYADFSKSLRHCMPTPLKRILGISQESRNGEYKIQTSYPKLVASIIQNARNSPFTQNTNTRCSFQYNLRFMQNCLDAINSESDALPPTTHHAKEEIFLLERTFSLGTRLLLYGKIDPLLIPLVRHMPNATTRFYFLETVLSLPGNCNVGDDSDLGNIHSVLIKLVGGYIFPVWQWLFYQHIHKRYADDPLEAVRAIESVLYDRPTLKPTPFLGGLEKIKSINRKSIKPYQKFSELWNVNWWAAPAITAEEETIPPLWDTPLFDPYTISCCINSE